MLTDAHAIAERMRDDYVSTEHLLLAICRGTRLGSEPGVSFGQQGVEPASVMDALTPIRGSQRVTSENPEATYQALEKYGRDLTEPARRGSSTR